MSRIRQQGLRREPPGGWPLDELFVGVATLRTTRELYRQEGSAPRPWDLAIWSGVSPQGTRNSLRRLEGVGLVKALRPDRPGGAPCFTLDRNHPLYPSLASLFGSERKMLRR
ncbi:MAG: hypothetical protein ACREF4_12995 [Gammaproteobacteria bacterium]